MDKVSTIEIQGIQWEIEDGNARERINKLETETAVKRTELWRLGNSYIEMVEYDGLVFYNGSFKDNIKVSSMGEKILTITPGKQKNETVQVFLAGDIADFTGRIPVVLNISKNGNVTAYLITENAYSGTYKECILFGDFFQLVN